MKLIPFDLEKALNGEPIRYRNGEVPPEWKYFETCKEPFPLATVDKYGEMHLHTNEGRYGTTDREFEYDLFMLPKKETLWYCSWRHENGEMGVTALFDYKSKGDFHKRNPDLFIIDQHTIEVEE